MEEGVYIIQHSDGLSNSTGTNELDEVISCSSGIAQVMPTYFKLIPFNIRNCSSISTVSTLIKDRAFIWSSH